MHLVQKKKKKIDNVKMSKEYFQIVLAGVVSLTYSGGLRYL